MVDFSASAAQINKVNIQGQVLNVREPPDKNKRFLKEVHRENKSV